ncbi:MAG: hypothetical protein ACREC6_11670 [Hyphomicrobiaceae bacterium]
MEDRPHDAAGTTGAYGKLPSDKVPVDHFRQILIWPLALEHPYFASFKETDGQAIPWRRAENIVGRVAEEIRKRWEEASEKERTRHWSPIDDALRYLTPSADKDAAAAKPAALGHQEYAEFVYFHSFVQRLLYRKREAAGTDAVPFHLFERRDIAHAEVDVPFLDKSQDKPRSGVLRFSCEAARLQLYLFGAGVAVLAAEVEVKGVAFVCAEPAAADRNRTLTLHDVLLFQDRFRRCYAPYWFGEDIPGQVPARVVWREKNGASVLDSTYGPEDAQAEFDKLDRGVTGSGQRFAPIFRHWIDLLPIRVCGYETPDACGRARWRHIVDERMPSMSYVALPKQTLKEVTRGDFVRLCFVDPPGTDELPYDAGFLACFEKDNCYDRFFYNGRNSEGNTRQMFSGYACCVVGDGEFFRNYIIDHFRRHYFQMALVSHLESAALLMFSNWISEAVAVLDPSKHHRTLEDAILKIHEALIAFAHASRFTGLSNQLQAGEMQAFWRRHLKLDTLFADVSQELKTATDYLLAKDQAESARAATSLTVVATFAAIFGLPMAFLGMNIVGSNMLSPISGWLFYLGVTAVSVGVFWSLAWRLEIMELMMRAIGLEKRMAIVALITAFGLLTLFVGMKLLEPREWSWMGWLIYSGIAAAIGAGYVLARRLKVLPFLKKTIGLR